jgi:hypothetical protein
MHATMKFIFLKLKHISPKQLQQVFPIVWVRKMRVDRWAQISSGPSGFNSLGLASPNHPSYVDMISFSICLCDSPIGNCFKIDSNRKKGTI